MDSKKPKESGKFGTLVQSVVVKSSKRKKKIGGSNAAALVAAQVRRKRDGARGGGADVLTVSAKLLGCVRKMFAVAICVHAVSLQL